MKKKTLGIIIVSVLGAAAIFCSAMFTHQYLDAKNSKSAFDDLTNLITEIDESQKDTEAEESDLSAEGLAAAEAALAREKYAALFAQNNDFIGWIKIDGTNVNYPVMQTPDKPDFYLKRSFDKSYSDYGVPYIDEACMTGISNNLVIHGHHMNDGSMYCCRCYNFYTGLSHAKKKDSIKAYTAQQLHEKEEAERQAKITELEDAIHSLDVQMELFEEISLIGVEVTQKMYGNGTVIAQEGSKITVQFPAKTTAYFINKQYTMRPRFENDEEIVEAFTKLDNLKAQKAKLEKELEQL